MLGEIKSVPKTDRLANLVDQRQRCAQSVSLHPCSALRNRFPHFRQGKKEHERRKEVSKCLGGFRTRANSAARAPNGIAAKESEFSQHFVMASEGWEGHDASSSEKDGLRTTDMAFSAGMSGDGRG